MSVRPTRVRARDAGVLAALLVLAAAPTAGDIGSCGQAEDDLDPARFYQEKGQVLCSQCRNCGFATETCARACASELGPTFPEGCFPLVHDGEVCLDALRDADCDDTQGFVRDEGAVEPTECAFCPPIGPRQESP